MVRGEQGANIARPLGSGAVGRRGASEARWSRHKGHQRQPFPGKARWACAALGARRQHSPWSESPAMADGSRARCIDAGPMLVVVLRGGSSDLF